MANSNPVKKFKKGSIEASLAGQKSSRALPPDLKEARLQNAAVFESTIYKYMNSPIETLKEILKDPATPSRDLVVIRILVLAIENGDHARLNFLLERTIGKVVDKMQVEAKVQTQTLHQQIIDIIELDKKNDGGN